MRLNPKTNMAPLKPKVSTHSPVPAKPKLMTFLEAIDQVLKGQKVRRESWPKDEYAFSDKGFLSIYRSKTYIWQIGDGDYLANDWILL